MASKIAELSEDVKELKVLLENAKRSKVQGILSIEMRKLETEISNLKATESSVPESTKPPVATTNRRVVADITNYGWDQSDKFVKLFITLKGVHTITEENVQIQYLPRNLSILVTELEGKDHKMTFNNLLNEIDTEKSYKKIKTDMIAIYLKKAKENIKWDFITVTEKRVSEVKNPMMGGDDKMDDGNPNAAIMNLMKKMYESGDPQTKQMIEKAYTENMNKTPQF